MSLFVSSALCFPDVVADVETAVVGTDYSTCQARLRCFFVIIYRFSFVECATEAALLLLSVAICFASVCRRRVMLAA
uniref:Secreted peptide n=1 Tax=Rhipicephalus pulchellus TaxID=72859 RepID=L7LUC1_RHIPC